MADKFFPIIDGDTISSSQVNTLFSTLQAEVNDLPITAIQAKSLHDVHLPSLVVDSGTASIGEAAVHGYRNRYPGWGDDTLTTTANAVGWAIINSAGHDGTGTDLEVDLGTAYTLDGTNAGLLILFNTNMTDLDDTSTGTGTSQIYGLFKIQIYTSGAWRSIARTERYSCAEIERGLGITADLASDQVDTQKDIAIRTFISDADLASPGNTVQKVRVLACVSRALLSAGTTLLTLKQTTLSAIIFHASLQESL